MKDDSNNKQLKFTEGEIEFLLENEVCRIATSYKDIPHIATVMKMVSFISQLIIIQENTRTLKRTEELLL